MTLDVAAHHPPDGRGLRANAIEPAAGAVLDLDDVHVPLRQAVTGHVHVPDVVDGRVDVVGQAQVAHADFLLRVQEAGTTWQAGVPRLRELF